MTVTDPTDPEVMQLRDRIEEYRSNYDFGTSHFDHTKILGMYKKDDDFHAYDVAPPVGGYPTWNVYSSKAWYQVMGKYIEIHFDFNDDLRIIRRGDVAWSTVSARWYGKTKASADFSKDIRLTLIWVKEDGVWLITHEHVSSAVLQSLPTGENI